MARRVTKAAAARKSRRASEKKLGRAVATPRSSGDTRLQQSSGNLSQYAGKAPRQWTNGNTQTRSMPEPRHSSPRKSSTRKPAIDFGNR